jgi:uncharacterized repeat protein (TIGR01451 family)
MVKVHSLSRLPRRLLSLLASVAMLFAIVPAVTLLTAMPANAIGSFQDHDGDLAATSGANDWNGIPRSGVNSELGTHFFESVDRPSGATDDSLGQGSKNSDTTVSVTEGTIPNNKADVLRSYLYEHNNDLYLAWVRAESTGDVHVDFELNKDAQSWPSATKAFQDATVSREIGDVLINYDWPGNGAPDITARVWNGTAWGTEMDLTTLGFADAAVNATVKDGGPGDVADGINNSTIPAEDFGEVGIDMVAAGFFSEGVCSNFSSVTVKTRSSGSGWDSELKDYIAPNPVTISNCSPVKILKEGAGTDTTKLAGAHFTIAPATNNDPAVPSGQSPCVTDSTGYCLVGDPGTFPLLFPGNYLVTETQAPPGYMLPALADRSQTISVPQSTDAVFHDPLGSLTVNKTGASSDTLLNAGWTLTATGGDAVTLGWGPETIDDSNDTNGDSNADGNADGTVSFDNLYTGTYTLTETKVPDGYTQHAAVTGIVISDSDTHRNITENLSDTKKTTHLTVYKTDRPNGDAVATPIGTATFQLWKENGQQLGLQTSGLNEDISTGFICTTGNDGYCTTSFGPATWGETYYWVETSVPWPYTVPDDNVTTVNVTLDNVDTDPIVTHVGDPLATINTSAGAQGANNDGSVDLTGSPATATLTDTATIDGIQKAATGSISWYLFGPGQTCDAANPDNASFVTSRDIVGPGTYPTGTQLPVTADVHAVGTYTWLAVLHIGDNVRAGDCSDPAEKVVVNPAHPTIVTVATSSDTVDGTISDTATVSGLAEPLSTQNPPTVTFTVYTDNTCDTAAPNTHTWTVDAIDNGDGTATATSGDYQLTNEFGTYYWTATFSGDSNNADITENNCGSTEGDNNEVSHAPVLDNPHKYNNPGTIGPDADPTDPTVSIYPSGNQVSYVITVHNSGDATMDNVDVTDTVSALADYNAGSAACDASGDQTGCSADDSGAPDLDWTFDLPAGGTAVLTFSVTVDPSDVNGDVIDNIAHVTNGETTKPTDETHNPVAFPVLAINKDANPLPREDDADGVVAPGDTIHYDVTVSNSGDAAADGVLVTDTVPAGTTYKPGSIDCTGTCTPDDSSAPDLAWTVDVPAAGEGGDGVVHVSFDVTVNADDPNGFIVANHAHFSWPTGVETEPFQSDDSRTITHIVEFPVLALEKTANPPSGSTVQRGDQIDYTITVTNTGLAPAPETVVTDTLPANVTVVDGSFNVEPDSIVDGVITWTVNVPAAGEGPGTVVLTYSVTVDQDAPQGSDQHNTVSIDNTCPGDETGDSCVTDHFVPTGDLTLVKFVNGKQRVTAKYGDTLTYTFDASTTGKLDQTDVHVTDVVPDGTTIVDGSAGCSDAGQCDATYDGATRTVTWSLGDMAAGTTRHLVFKVTIDTPQADANGGLPPETIFNFGVIGSTETQNTPSNKVRADIVAVLGEKVVKPPKAPQVLPFTGAVLPLRAAGLVGLLMIGIGVALSSTRRRRRS